MTSSASERGVTGSTLAQDGVLYVERRWLTGIQIFALMTVVVAGVFMSIETVREAPERAVAFALWYTAFVILVLGICISPLTVGFSHIRIDRTGLTLWWARFFRLPAEELGDAWVVPEAEAGPSALRGRYSGVKIPTGRSSYPGRGGGGPAVFVEQRRPGSPPVGWLLATRNPGAVIEALGHLRKTPG